jgi:hypothetical protein
MRHTFRRIMHNWIIDYHHAWLIRLIGLVVLLCVVFAFRLLARQVRQLGGTLLRHLPQGTPLCRHQKL